MTESTDTITVRVNVDIATEALKTIVETAKKRVGPDDKGHYRVDTADKVGEIISRFLLEKNFEEYVRHPEHFSD
jgi:aromatic ring-cleaving dioxygenase